MNTTIQERDAPVEYGGKIVPRRHAEAMIRDKRESIISGMVKMRDQWIAWRRQKGVEDRWRKSRELFLGEDNGIEYGLQETLKSGVKPAITRRPTNRSTVVVNIVRPRVEAAVARMAEILLPVDDKNWGIKPTPVPSSVQKMLGNHSLTLIPGTNVVTDFTADQEARLYIEAAKEASEAMQDTIDDQLTESGYNGKSREGLDDGVVLGTMILKGPVLHRQTSKTWLPQADGSSALVMDEKTQPGVERCDPWDVFFDPACGNDHQRGSGVWHRRMVTRKELRDLVGLPGYDADAIREVLATRPTRLYTAEQRVTRILSQEDTYELWEYHGWVDPYDMMYCSLGTGDPLEDVDFGVVMIINDRVIGTIESWIPDKTLPYSVWCWRKDDSSPYGYGLPMDLEHQQRVITAAWRQVMDNAKITLGGQIVLRRKGIVPHDGNLEIYANKLWIADEGVDDVEKAFRIFQIESRIPELLTIADKAMQFADFESSTPQMMSGEKGGNAPETLGGMVMLWQNANVVLRMRVKRYDDGITRPMLSRFYDWNMANNPDPAIKGDSEVDARGSTALLERDLQNMATMNLANILMNPKYAPFVDPEKELDVILKAMKVNPIDVKLPADRIKQNLENPPEQPEDPRIASAKIKAQVDMAKLADQDKVRQMAAQTLEYNRAREQGEFEIAMTEASLERDQAILKINSDVQLTREQIAAKERLEALQIANERELFNAEMHVKAQMGSGI